LDLATFQTIINKLLRDLINTGNVASFINDTKAGIEEKEEHDKLVKEILRRIEENNLCIKIKEEKIKVVLEWPASKKFNIREPTLL